MASVKLPGLYGYYVNGQTEFEFPGNTVTEVLENVFSAYPTLRKQLFDTKGEKKRHINIFINKVSIKELESLDSSVAEKDVITILPNISGG